jgi:hypothetical protein
MSCHQPHPGAAAKPIGICAAPAEAGTPPIPTYIYMWMSGVAADPSLPEALPWWQPAGAAPEGRDLGAGARRWSLSCWTSAVEGRP